MKDTLLVDSVGRPITDRAVRRGLRISIIAGATGMCWAAMAQNIPLMMFMEALGSSGVLIGLVATVAQIAFIVQLPGALFAERMAFRKTWWGIIMIVSRALWLMPVVFIMVMADHPIVIAWCMIGLVLVTSIMGQSVTALWFSWMADLVPDSVSGRFWGTRQSYTMTAYLIAMTLVGYVLDTFPAAGQPGGSWAGFMIVFIIGTILGCIDIIIHLWVPEPRSHKQDQHVYWLRRILDPMRNSDFRRLTIAMGLYTLAISLGSLGIIYLKKDFHLSYSHLTAITVSACLGSIAFSFIWGHVMDRIGGRAFCSIMMTIAPLVMVVWLFVKDYETNIIGIFEAVPWAHQSIQALVNILPYSWECWIKAMVLPQPVWLLLFVNFLAGALYGGIGLAQLSLSAILAPEKGRTMAMAVHWSVAGVIGALGAVTAGWVMDWFVAHPVEYVFFTGTRFAFHHVLVASHVLIIWVIVLPMVLRISRRKGELPVSTALSRLFVSNPIQVVTNIYLMSAAVTSHRRADAVRNLGDKRVVIAVSDLIEKLDDPSIEVREASAHALGSIGSPEAIDALVTKLDDPQSDIVPQIARALRQSKNMKSIEALVRKLSDSDRETRSESARTLGKIGDRRAVPSLMNLLSNTNDSKVVSSSSDALARLGEIAAIYEIFPRMRQTQNPVLKRSLAVAIADLLGEPDEFYKILTKEQHSHGSQVEQLMSELRRHIRNATHKCLTDEGKILRDKTREIELLYENEQFADCAQVLFNLAIGLSALYWGVKFGGNSKALVNDLIWRDQRFGVGVWYLDLLRRSGEDADPGTYYQLDTLIGIYFLAQHGFKK